MSGSSRAGWRGPWLCPWLGPAQWPRYRPAAADPAVLTRSGERGRGLRPRRDGLSRADRTVGRRHTDTSHLVVPVGASNWSATAGLPCASKGFGGAASPPVAPAWMGRSSGV